MIWSKLDFEREVRRQLIELESIRKRVPADSEVRQRIDRLEASHVNLLRKLEEIFPGHGQGHSQGHGSQGHGHSALSHDSPLRGQFERHLRTLVKTSEAQAIAETVRQRITLSSGVIPKALFASQVELPSLDAPCSTCGRILLSSLLAGDEILFAQGAWHHSECQGEGEPYQKPGMLN